MIAAPRSFDREKIPHVRVFRKLWLPVPQDALSAMQVWPSERLLAPSTVVTRNRQWLTFTRYLEEHPQQQPDVINAQGEYVKIDLLDPQAVISWVVDDLISKASAKDYLCTVRDRATYLQVWTPGPAGISALARAQARIKLVAKQDPKKATPVPEKAVKNLTAPLALQARFLTATGLRDCGARDIIFRGPEHPTPNQVWVKFKKTHDKTWALDVYAPASVVRSIHDFHEKAGPLVTPLFPMTPKAMTILLHSLGPGYTTHSFRRTFALGVRIKAETLGVTSKAQYEKYRVAERASKIAQWTMDSRSFFEYSDDFRCWMREPLCVSKCVIEWVLQDLPAYKNLGKFPTPMDVISPRKIALPPDDEAPNDRKNHVPRLMFNNAANFGNTKVIKNAFKPRKRLHAILE